MHEQGRANTSLAVPGVLAHRLQCHTGCKIQYGHLGAPKWRWGLERGPTFGYWPLQTTFVKYFLSYPITLSMRNAVAHAKIHPQAPSILLAKSTDSSREVYITVNTAEVKHIFEPLKNRSSPCFKCITLRCIVP